MENIGAKEDDAIKPLHIHLFTCMKTQNVCESLCNQNVLNRIQWIEFSVHLVMGGFYSIASSNEKVPEVSIETADEYIIDID